MDGGGFEPPKALLTDLQSAPFGRSGIHPHSEVVFVYEASPHSAFALCKKLNKNNEALCSAVFFSFTQRKKPMIGLEPITC